MPGVPTRQVAPLENLEDRFILAAGLIVVSIITYAVAGDHRIGQVAVVAVQSATMLVILHASRVKPRTMRLAYVLLGAALLATIVSTTLDRQSVGPGVAGSLLALFGPVVIVRRVLTHAKIDFETVAASLCIYLLFGVFFAYVYRIIDIVDGRFFVQPHVHAAVNFVYFSFTTLTTTGYGDLTARLDLGRMLAISEALLGQLYLVSVVALLVANLGRPRRLREAREIEDIDDVDDVDGEGADA
jgi:hypothetical protein